MKLLNSEPLPKYSWSRIFFAALINVAAGSFFMLLGNAIGLTPDSIIDTGDPAPDRLLSGAYVWTLLTLSFYLGGKSCSQLTEALASWAVSTLLVAIFASIAFNAAIVRFFTTDHVLADWFWFITVATCGLSSAAGQRFDKILLVPKPEESVEKTDQIKAA